MTTGQIAILVLAFVGLALVLAVVVNRIGRWRKSATEQPTIKRSEQPESPPSLRDMNILPPHKSAARPSHVMALSRKPIRKSPPKTAA